MSTVFKVLKDNIGGQIETLQTALYSNRAESLEDYRFMTGQLRGLTVALNHIKDLEKQVNEQEWED